MQLWQPDAVSDRFFKVMQQTTSVSICPNLHRRIIPLILWLCRSGRITQAPLNTINEYYSSEEDSVAPCDAQKP